MSNAELNGQIPSTPETGKEPIALAPWLKTALATAGIVLGGVVASLAPMQSQIDRQGTDLVRLQAKQETDREQLHRIEDKLDGLVERMAGKP